MLPGIAMSLLPKVTCPACWPAYAGLLSSLGLSFVPLSTAYLLPITTAFLLVAVAALGFRARQRRGYRPMLLGMVASAVVLFGKFSLDSSAVMYLGLIVIITASVWNSWPRGERQQVLCPQCAPEGSELIQLSAQEKSQ
jgi:mercuric ion transport protein